MGGPFEYRGMMMLLAVSGSLFYRGVNSWARFAPNLPRILLSMGWDFLSHHTSFLYSFTFPSFLISPGILPHACIYINSTTPTPYKKQANTFMPSNCLSSTTLPLCCCSYQAYPPLPSDQHSKQFYSLRSTMAAVATETPFHVLAVDDSLPDRKLIERLLKTSYFQVTTVDSGSKALQFLGLHDEDTPVSVNADQLDVAVNLVITDYCMPGMTGYDLLKKIKESSSLRDIPVVIMSSENIPSRINRCLEEGADEFILKPVRLSDMSKLKPHILKSRCKEHYHQEQQQQSDCDSNGSSDSTYNSSNNSRKRKAADDEILPQTTRLRH